MRHRQRHVHATIHQLVRDSLTTGGWIDAPVNFGATPVTLLDYEPQQAGETPAPNTVAVSIGAEDEDEEFELGGLETTRYAVFIDIYAEKEAIGVALAGDLKDLIKNIYTPLLDFSADPPAATTDHIEFEHVMIEVIPSAATTLDKRTWRSVKAMAVCYH